MINKKVISLVWILVITQLLIGCKVPSAPTTTTPFLPPTDTSTPPIITVTAPPTNLPPTTQQIDASLGGVIEVINPTDPSFGAKLTVPPGALETDMVLSISSVINPALILPEVVVTEFEPDLSFRVPAILQLTYTDAFLSMYGIEDESLLTIISIDEATGIWEPSAENRVDPVNNIILAEITHLSSWSIVSKSWLTTRQKRDLIQPDPFVMGERNVLFIHGFNGSPGDDCMSEVINVLEGLYDHVAAYQYPSALSIEKNAKWLADEISRQFPDGNFDIVGYSEGGLVARTLIEQNQFQDRVDNLVTIATPHKGILEATALSLLPLPAIAGPGASIPIDVLRTMFPAVFQQMYGSEFLRNLNAAYKPGHTEYHTIAGTDKAGSDTDGVVKVNSAHGTDIFTPAQSETIPNISHSQNTGSPSSWMPCDQRVYDLLKRWLPDSSPTITPTPPTETPFPPGSSFPGTVMLSCGPGGRFSNVITLVTSEPAQRNAHFKLTLTLTSGPIDKILKPKAWQLIVFTKPGQSISSSVGDLAKCDSPGGCSATYEITEAGYGVDKITYHPPIGLTVKCDF